jgi:hypothetical protein
MPRKEHTRHLFYALFPEQSVNFNRYSDGAPASSSLIDQKIITHSIVVNNHGGSNRRKKRKHG